MQQPKKERSGFPEFTQADLQDPKLIRFNRLIRTLYSRIPNVDDFKVDDAGAAGKVVAKVLSQTITNNITGASGIYFNVLDSAYGAVGDGTSNDAPAIKAAYDAAVAAGGGTVYLPGGHTYSIHDFLALDSDVPVTFLGDGDSSVVIRGGTITSGNGVFDVASTGANITFQNFLTNGDTTTAVQLQYSDFSGDPMDPQLTDNSMFWVHAGAKNISWYAVNWTHTSGYGALMNSDVDDVDTIVFYGCKFENVRPHWFGVTAPDTIYGAWTGGIFYRGDCLSPNIFSVRNLTVLGCNFKRVNGNCIWGHCLGFDTHHTNVNILSNIFEDCALDCIEMGNVYGGNVSGNIGHRIGYTTATDTDTPTPAFLPAKPATFIDNSGYVEAVTFGPNQVVSVNGGAYDLDGVRNCTFSGLQADIPESGSTQYVEDQIALYGPLQNGVLSSRGINMGNTSMNGGAVSVTLNNPKISGFGYAAICMSYAKNCKVIAPHITHPTGSAEPPILLFSVSGSPETLNSGNVITSPHITYSGIYYCVEERGTGWTSAVKNRVFDTEIIGTPAGEFLPDAGTSSLSGVTTGNFTWREQVAPPVSAVGESRTYMDSTIHTVQISQNGGAYVDFGTTAAGSDKWVQFKDGTLMGASINLQYDKTLRKVTSNGISGTSAIDASGGFISSAEGFFTGYAQWNAIQATAGGLFGLNVNVGNYVAMASQPAPSPTGSDVFTGNGIMHYDAGVTSFRFRFGTGATTLADAFAVGAGFQATGSAGNDIQAPSGGVSGKFLIATDSLFFIHEAAPVISVAGQSKIYMDSTSHTVKISQNGGAFVDIVGASVVAGSNTYVQYNNTGSFGADSGFTYNSGLHQLTTTGGMITTTFNSTATGATATFQNANSNFSVDGDGNISAVGTINMLRNDAGYSYKISRSSATARSYGWLIDASGNLILNDATAGSARMIISTSGVFTWGSAVALDQSGALSASGVIASTGASGGFNQSSASQTAYNTFQSVGGGFKGRNFTSGVYIQIGQNSGAPTMSTGDTVANGCMYYDTGSNTVKVRISGSFVDINTGAAGGVTSITGTTNQVIASASTGAVTLSLPQSIATTSAVTFGSVTTSSTTTGAFNSGSTGTNITFQNANSNFSVNGNGAVSCASDINTLGLYKKSGVTMIDSSGTFVGAGLATTTNGVGCTGYYTWNGTSYIAGLGTPFSSNTITIASTVSFVVTGGIVTAVTAVSDSRMKTVEKAFDRGLAAINGLRPVLYRWNDLAHRTYKGIGTELTMGFIAQNVAEYIPEAGGLDQHGYHQFNRDGVICALVVAIQELSAEVASLRLR